MQEFLIIRLSSLGDIIHTIPAYAALRKKFPMDRISWLVEPRGREILGLVSGIDKVVVFDRKKWFQSLGPVRKREQTVFDFQGLLKSSFLGFLTGSRRRIGFSRKNLKEPLASLFYSEQIAELPEKDLHVISKNLRLLGARDSGEERYEFPIHIPEKLREHVRLKLLKIGHVPGQKLVVCNVGAAWESKRWPPDKWETVINAIRWNYAYVLLLWGDDAELRLAREISSRTKTDVAPFFSIQEVIALLKETSLLISGDTFALQAGCALETPVVGIFGPTNPSRNGPFNPRDKVSYQQRPCSPCYQTACDTMECMKSINPDEVGTLAVRLLAKQ